MNTDEVARIVGPLRKAQELLGSAPEVAEALLPALNVSFFILESGHAHNFEDYLAGFRNTGLPMLGVFPGREEFDAWLKTHLVPPPRGVVEISGGRYTLGYSLVSGQPLLLRLPPVESLLRPGGAEGQEELWLALDKAREALGDSPEDVDALQSAALAFHFIHEAGCAREFAHFLAHFDEHLPPLRSFTTRDEAEAWLKSHPSPPHGASVQVGGDVLTVGYQRERDQRVLVRFPRDEEPGEDPRS